MDQTQTTQINLLGEGNDDKDATFAPQINTKSQQMIRDKPVQDLLYDDAIRRKEAISTRQSQVYMAEDSKQSKISNTNIEYLVHKFNREFEPIYDDIARVEDQQNDGEGDAEVEETPQQLNYRQLGELLYAMGYLSGSQSSESEERILLSTMWSSLGGEQNDGLQKEVIRAFLIAVEGVKITDGVKTEGPEDFGETKDGDFYPDCEKISKHFKLFYLNRIRYIGLREQPRNERAKKENEKECTFKPNISETTENYARKYRQRIADAYDGEKITVLDILTASTNKQQWIEETKKEHEEKEKRECTFRPKTNDYQGNQSQQNPYGVGQGTGDKCFDLYQISVAKKKMDEKSTEQVEFEKNQEELTFHPNLEKKKPRTANKNYKVNQRSIQDNIERMRKAREEREMKKMMTERGYNPAQANYQMKHGKEKAMTEKQRNYHHRRPQL